MKLGTVSPSGSLQPRSPGNFRRLTQQQVIDEIVIHNGIEINEPAPLLPTIWKNPFNEGEKAMKDISKIYLGDIENASMKKESNNQYSLSVDPKKFLPTNDLPWIPNKIFFRKEFDLWIPYKFEGSEISGGKIKTTKISTILSIKKRNDFIYPEKIQNEFFFDFNGIFQKMNDYEKIFTINKMADNAKNSDFVLDFPDYAIRTVDGVPQKQEAIPNVPRMRAVGISTVLLLVSLSGAGALSRRRRRAAGNSASDAVS
jgi:hypothetical protein